MSQIAAMASTCAHRTGVCGMAWSRKANVLNWASVSARPLVTDAMEAGLAMANQVHM